MTVRFLRKNCSVDLHKISLQIKLNTACNVYLFPLARFNSVQLRVYSSCSGITVYLHTESRSTGLYQSDGCRSVTDLATNAVRWSVAISNSV
jgi:hypothetical protein